MTVLTETLPEMGSTLFPYRSSLLVETNPVNFLGCNPIRWELLVG